ncbi:MAG: hypothetical protein FWD41_02495 [Actinomycetia bacterium]|nr:hypothetical protein [Actinomycetes bacterium]
MSAGLKIAFGLLFMLLSVGSLFASLKWDLKTPADRWWEERLSERANKVRMLVGLTVIILFFIIGLYNVVLGIQMLD